MSKYTDKDLLEIIKKYHEEIGFPTQREFKSSNGLPSSVTYFNRFGSFKKAIELAGIDIPDEKQKLFKRNNDYASEEIKGEFDILVDLYLIDNVTLPPIEYFNNSDFISESLLYRRYGTKQEIYKSMGYNLEEFNENRMKEDMINKYLEIKDILGYLPNSRDINRFSKGNKYYYTMTTYINHFKNLSKLQRYLGELPTVLGKNISNEEILKGLYQLKDELKRVPSQIDINECSYLPRVPSILNKLNYAYLVDLQMDLFGETVEINHKYITNNGTKCLSTFEYIVAQVIEKCKYDFGKDIKYKKYITTLFSNHTVDFVIHKNNKYYFIEVFGLMTYPEYAEKAKWKIQLCKDNNIPLLELYPKDISMSQFDELSDTIRKFTEN